MIHNETAQVYNIDALNASNGKVKFVVNGKNEWQTLKICAKDRAGNEVTEETMTFLLTPNLWVQFYHHKPLFYSSLLTVFLMVAGIFVYHRCKKIRSM